MACEFSRRGGVVKLQKKTVSASTTGKVNVLPDAGYTALSGVDVNQIRLQHKNVYAATTTKTVTPDSGYDGLSSVWIGGVGLQSKSLVPSQLPYTFYPDSGYDGLSSATVQKPLTLIPNNIVAGRTILGVAGAARRMYPAYLEGTAISATQLSFNVEIEFNGNRTTLDALGAADTLTLVNFAINANTGTGSNIITKAMYVETNQAAPAFERPSGSLTFYAISEFVETITSFLGNEYVTLTLDYSTSKLSVTRQSNQYSYAIGSSWSGTAVFTTNS